MATAIGNVMVEVPVPPPLEDTLSQSQTQTSYLSSIIQTSRRALLLAQKFNNVPECQSASTIDFITQPKNEVEKWYNKVPCVPETNPFEWLNDSRNKERYPLL